MTTPTIQKFHRGDMVRIAKDLGPSMSHFECDQDAVVIGSYSDQYGGSNNDSYTLLLADGSNTISWYYERQLTFVRKVGEEGIKKIKDDREESEKNHDNLDWIFENWKSIRKKIPTKSAMFLMAECGITNPWPSGEMMEYYTNFQAVFLRIGPFLESGDKEGLITRMKEMKAFINSKR